MSWKTIKAKILGRHEHAEEHDAEVRLVLGFGDLRVAIVVRQADDAAVVVAQVANGTAHQIIAMLRAATNLDIPLVVFGDTACVRTRITADNVEEALQATARAALRVRRAAVPARADVAAFAFAL
ncbi:MAG: hypothetical protein ACKV2T_39060 [Kofleriaceae bacterium]